MSKPIPANRHSISTIQSLYSDQSQPALTVKDPSTRRHSLNRSAYARLHRTSSASNRHSVGNLKERFEKTTDERKEDAQNLNESSEQLTFTPKDFGYPEGTKLKPPILKPKPVIPKRPPKDENSNVVQKDGEPEVAKVICQSASEESIDKIAKELDSFEMDKQKKKVSNLKKFWGTLFAKDKKKKEEEKRKVNDDNVRNESNFNRGSYMRRTVPTKQEEEKMKELEKEYAQSHVNRFNSIRQNFNGVVPVKPDFDNVRPAKSNYHQESTIIKQQNYNEPVKLNHHETNNKSNFNGVPVKLNLSRSNSLRQANNDPDKSRDTPPRAQETIQNIQVVNPKEPFIRESPRTIERNLNRANSKDYPDKDTYSTVFDSLELQRRGAPSPSRILESTKLKLPPNREIYEPLPRVKSPIPTNRVSTEKLIATELLKTRTPPPSPLPIRKPPQSPIKPKRQDVVTTNAQIHIPPEQSPSYLNLPPRATTPVNLRMSVSQKMTSPTSKREVRKSVEEYYWTQLKKLKEEQDYKLQAELEGVYQDESRGVRRSRSLSPNSHRNSRRSVSLPRDPRTDYVDYVRIPPQAIPEEGVMNGMDMRNERYFVYDHLPPRRPLPSPSPSQTQQRPIFRRGSLTQPPEIYDSSPYNKRVSFQQAYWSPRNDDEVFIPVSYRPNQVQYYQYRPRRPSGDSLQRSPAYSNEPLYNRQVTMRNKVCDMYGQIHDAPNKGVVMGRLQAPPPVFMRGGRLTASDNDLGRRYMNRPLPPPPLPPHRTMVSDSESCSDASEIQRIMGGRDLRRGK